MSTYGIGSIYRVHQIKNNYTLTNSAKQTFACDFTWICILRSSYARYRALGWMWSWKRSTLLQMVSAK